jgi:hypothetical protein
VDLPPAVKSLYTAFSVLLNGIEVAQILPYTVVIPIGVSEIKIIAKSITQSYEEKACLLYDDNLQCNLATHLATLDKDKLTQSNIPYLYYILKEGTITANNCGCYCEYLDKMYKDIIKQIDGTDCNC